MQEPESAARPKVPRVDVRRSVCDDADDDADDDAEAAGEPCWHRWYRWRWVEARSLMQIISDMPTPAMIFLRLYDGCRMVVESTHG